MWFLVGISIHLNASRLSWGGVAWPLHGSCYSALLRKAGLRRLEERVMDEGTDMSLLISTILVLFLF